MAKKTVCDVCDKPITDGNNFGARSPVFSWSSPESPTIEVTTKVRIEGKTDPDLCLPCLKRAVAEA